VGILKLEKKERITRKQKSRSILIRNRKINRMNIYVLGSGLLLMFLGENQIASVIIWIGFAIFVYTIISNAIARRSKM